MREIELAEVERVSGVAVLLDQLADGRIGVGGNDANFAAISSRISAASLSVWGSAWETGMLPRCRDARFSSA
jgi:hypothetical protein